MKKHIQKYIEDFLSEDYRKSYCGRRVKVKNLIMPPYKKPSARNGQVCKTCINRCY